MKKTKTAGGLVFHEKTGKVLVVNQNHNSWSLPKGHIDEGETAEEAAIREIYEESGVTSLQLIKKLGKYERYRIGKNGVDDMSELKEIEMFLFSSDQDELNPVDPDNPMADWIPVHEVSSLLTHSKDIEFFEKNKTQILIK